MKDFPPYALSEFGLSGISTKRHLAEVLLVPLASLRKLQLLGDKAYSKRLKKTNSAGKLRMTHDPCRDLKAIQRRINALLQRVEHPAYLQAGLRGESRGYINNANSHSVDDCVSQLDIKSFFTNCKREYVYQFFVSLSCSPDVCALLADLTTFEGFLPTGGPTSLLFAYWAHRDTFEAIASLATRHGLKMTVYVDDFTFSGARITDVFMNEVRCLLSRVGLKGHKQKMSYPGGAKVITGVAVTARGTRLPFKRCKLIKEGYDLLRNAASYEEKMKHLDTLISRLSAAALIEEGYKKQLLSMKAVRRELKAKAPIRWPTAKKRVVCRKAPSAASFQRMIETYAHQLQTQQTQNAA